MYWTILINESGYTDRDMLSTRWGDEARFKFKSHGGSLLEIIIYDVEALWYKTVDPSTGSFTNRCNDDVVQEIQDHLYYCGHDVIGCQRHEGIP